MVKIVIFLESVKNKIENNLKSATIHHIETIRIVEFIKHA